jgi:hypothetical protein
MNNQQLMLCLSKNRPTYSASVFLLINLPHVRFSTTPVRLRAYEVWVALAKRHGFSPAEVLEASTLGAYVVVDPMNKSSLLSLSPMAYQKLLGQVMATENLNLVLLLSPLDNLEPSAPEASSEANQTSPPQKEFWRKKISIRLSQFKDKVLSGTYKKQKSNNWYAGYPFQGYQGLLSGVKVVNGRLSFGKDSVLFTTIFQRWASRLMFWTNAPRGRLNRYCIRKYLLFLKGLYASQGALGTALYLKACYLITLRYLAGERFQYAFSTTGVPVKIVGGLPASLPRQWREAIRSHNYPLIRAILSLFYSYKSFKASKSIAVDDILSSVRMETPPDFSIYDKVIAPFPKFVHAFLSRYTKPVTIPELVPDGLLPSIRGGPNGPLAALAYGADAFAWRQRELAPNQPAVPGPFEWIKHFEL